MTINHLNIINMLIYYPDHILCQQANIDDPFVNASISLIQMIPMSKIHNEMNILKLKRDSMIQSGFYHINYTPCLIDLFIIHILLTKYRSMVGWRDSSIYLKTIDKYMNIARSTQEFPKGIMLDILYMYLIRENNKEQTRLLNRPYRTRYLIECLTNHLV